MKYTPYIVQFLLLSLVMGLSPTLVGAQISEQSSETTQTLEELGVAIKTEQPVGAVLAVALPDVYILPGSRLYWIVQIWESIRLLITEDPAERAEVLLGYSKKRLAETYALVQDNSLDTALQTIERYKVQLNEALTQMQDIPDSAKQQENYNGVQEHVWYQKALHSIITAKGITDAFAGMANAVTDSADTRGSLELEAL